MITTGAGHSATPASFTRLPHVRLRLPPQSAPSAATKPLYSSQMAPYSHASIANLCNVRLSTLSDWLRDPAFNQSVDDKKDQFAAQILERGIAVKTNRIKRANERYDKLHEVIEARAADPAMQHVPGGKTGLLVHHRKSIGPKGDNEFVDEYEVDTATLSEIRAHEDQVSAELGQRPRESSGSNVTVQAVIMLPRPATSAPVVIDLEPTK